MGILSRTGWIRKFVLMLIEAAAAKAVTESVTHGIDLMRTKRKKASMKRRCKVPSRSTNKASCGKILQLLSDGHLTTEEAVHLLQQLEAA